MRIHGIRAKGKYLKVKRRYIVSWEDQFYSLDEFYHFISAKNKTKTSGLMMVVVVGSAYLPQALVFTVVVVSLVLPQ